MSEALDYEQFATTRARRLFQVAYLMCGDWHQAQDLVQITFAKLYSTWGRLERTVPDAGLDAYARKVLLNSYLSHRRLRRSSEVAVAEVADSSSPPDDGASGRTEVRLALLDALRQLPPRNRAVVVLRYLEDYSVETVADALNITPGAVKSLNYRSLARLREILGDDRELFLQL